MNTPQQIFIPKSDYNFLTLNVKKVYEREDDLYVTLINADDKTPVEKVISKDWTKSGSQLIFTSKSEIKEHIASFLNDEIQNTEN